MLVWSGSVNVIGFFSYCEVVQQITHTISVGSKCFVWSIYKETICELTNSYHKTYNACFMLLWRGLYYALLKLWIGGGLCYRWPN